MFPSVMLHCSAPQPPLRLHAPSTQSIIPEYGGLKAVSGSSLSKGMGGDRGDVQETGQDALSKDGVAHSRIAGGHSHTTSASTSLSCCSVELFYCLLENGVEAQFCF